MSEEERKLYEEIQKKSTVQSAANSYIENIKETQDISSQILEQYNQQSIVSKITEQSEDVDVNTLLRRLNEYSEKNITPYINREAFVFSDNYKRLYLYCCNLPNYIHQALINGGEMPIANVGCPDAELLNIIETWIQSYLDYNFPEEKYTVQLIVPEYQNDCKSPIYKPIDVIHFSIRKNEKTI